MPSILALSRQGLPQLRFNDDEKSGNIRTKTAGKQISTWRLYPQRRICCPITLLATSEVSLADEARTMLENHYKTCVCPLSRSVTRGMRAIKQNCLNVLVVVEAGLEMGWAALTYGRASFVGMTGFGASAPAGDLYAHFKITKEAVVAAAKAKLA